MLALLCALLLLTQSCLALSGTLDALDAAESLTLTVGGLKVERLTGSDKGLQTLNAFAAPLSASVAVGGDTALLRLMAGDREISSLRMDADAGTERLPHKALEAVFTEALPALFDACMPAEEPPEPEERSVSVRNLGRSTRRTTLTVTPEQFAAAGPALAGFRECVSRLSAHLPHAAEIMVWLDQMEAVSDLTLKRLENDGGDAVAWQLTGQIASGGKDVRKLTLYGGVNGKNVYVSLKLPARSGKNRLELTADLKDTAGKKKNTWSGTVTYKRNMNGVSLTLKDTVDLTDDHSDGEKITGSLKREHTADGIKTVWTVTPSLRGDGRSLEGRLTCRKKHAQTVVWQAELTVSAAVGADPGEAAAADETLFAAQVLNYLTGYRNSLPEADRRQLDHMLRTDSWMNGAVIPVPSAK